MSGDSGRVEDDREILCVIPNNKVVTDHYGFEGVPDDALVNIIVNPKGDELVFKCGRTQIPIYINQILEVELKDGKVTLFLRPGWKIAITPPENWYKSLVGVLFDLMANYEQRAPNNVEKIIE